MKKEELASYIDHVCLKAYANRSDMKKLCDEAVKYGFRMAAINSSQTAFVSGLLKGTGVHTGAAVGFPLGQTTIAVKVFETKDAIENGADEIDYVVNLSELKNGNWKYVEKEMDAIVSVCRERGVISKAIFENCYLDRSEIKLLAETARRCRPDYIKTSTGFGTGGAELDDVVLMKQTVGDLVKVKAAGGIRTLDKCLAFIEAGAERIGTTAGVSIMEELISKQRESE